MYLNKMNCVLICAFLIGSAISTVKADDKPQLKLVNVVSNERSVYILAAITPFDLLLPMLIVVRVDQGFPTWRSGSRSSGDVPEGSLLQ